LNPPPAIASPTPTEGHCTGENSNDEIRMTNQIPNSNDEVPNGR
jgi:hypothetical protein